MSNFEADTVFAEVGRALAQNGKVTFQSLVKDTGVSIGSLYHRFGSRENLLAQSWLDAVECFQTSFLTALMSEAPDAGEKAAISTPRFCREQKNKAILLVCCRPSEFMNAKTPRELRNRIENTNDVATKAVRRFARRESIPLEAARFGLVGFPLGAVRLYLPRQPVPRSADAYIAAAYRSAIAV